MQWYARDTQDVSWTFVGLMGLCMGGQSMPVPPRPSAVELGQGKLELEATMIASGVV